MPLNTSVYHLIVCFQRSAHIQSMWLLQFISLSFFLSLVPLTFSYAVYMHFHLSLSLRRVLHFPPLQFPLLFALYFHDPFPATRAFCISLVFCGSPVCLLVERVIHCFFSLFLGARKRFAGVKLRCNTMYITARLKRFRVCDVFHRGILLLPE